MIILQLLSVIIILLGPILIFEFLRWRFSLEVPRKVGAKDFFGRWRNGYEKFSSIEPHVESSGLFLLPRFLIVEQYASPKELELYLAGESEKELILGLCRARELKTRSLPRQASRYVSNIEHLLSINLKNAKFFNPSVLNRFWLALNRWLNEDAELGKQETDRRLDEFNNHLTNCLKNYVLYGKEFTG